MLLSYNESGLAKFMWLALPSPNCVSLSHSFACRYLYFARNVSSRNRDTSQLEVYFLSVQSVCSEVLHSDSSDVVVSQKSSTSPDNFTFPLIQLGKFYFMAGRRSLSISQSANKNTIRYKEKFGKSVRECGWANNKEFVSEWERTVSGYFTRSVHSKLVAVLASDVSNLTLDSNSFARDVGKLFMSVILAVSNEKLKFASETDCRYHTQRRSGRRADWGSIGIVLAP